MRPFNSIGFASGVCRIDAVLLTSSTHHDRSMSRYMPKL